MTVGAKDPIYFLKIKQNVPMSFANGSALPILPSLLPIRESLVAVNLVCCVNVWRLLIVHVTQQTLMGDGRDVGVSEKAIEKVITNSVFWKQQQTNKN